MISPWLLRMIPPALRDRVAGRSYLLKAIDNTGWIFAERVLRHGIGFVVGALTARYLGPEQYGVFNYAFAFVLVFGFLGTLGLDPVAVREMVRDPPSHQHTLGTLMLMRVVGGLVMAAVIATSVILISPSDPRVWPLILAMSVAQLLLATDAIDCWFQANLASHYTVVARLVSFGAVTVLRLGLIYFEAPLIAFAWANLVETSVLLAAMLMVYQRSGQRVSRLGASLACAKSLWKNGWPLFVSAGIAGASQRLDQVLLGQLSGFVNVGAYSIAVRVIETTYILPAVIATSIFPALIKLKAGDAREYEARMQALCSAMLWLALAIAVPLSLFSGPLVRLLVGSAYDAAVTPLAILSWMPVFVFFNVVRQRWLLAEQAVSVALAVEFAGCALSILLNLLLIPKYGAAGSAMAALGGALGSTVVVAPFSGTIRRSLAMLIGGFGAPIRVLRRA